MVVVFFAALLLCINLLLINESFDLLLINKTRYIFVGGGNNFMKMDNSNLRFFIIIYIHFDLIAVSKNLIRNNHVALLCI